MKSYTADTLKAKSGSKYVLTPVYRCSLVREGSLKAVTGSHRARSVALAMLKDSPNERVLVILLNTENKVIGVSEVTFGTLDASLVHPREFFRPAILANAASVILAHNHPSGDTTPSREDHAVYRRLRGAGELLGIEVLDSVITGDDDAISIVESGVQ